MTEGTTEGRRYIYPELEKALKEYGQPIHYSDLAELVGYEAPNVCSSLALQVRQHPRGVVRRVGRGTYEYVGRGRRGAVTTSQPALDEDIEPDDIADILPTWDSETEMHAEVENGVIRRVAVVNPPGADDELRGHAKQIHAGRLRRIARLCDDLLREIPALDAELRTQKRKADAWDKLQDTVKQLEIRERHQ